ncbi:MAG: hypothetical protein F4Y16_00965 [Holophagales bacterium]|nr:hypothetical protein [Holophagales bacterium]MYH24954.1 hypothetical protein [Holophagales bacterium]
MNRISYRFLAATTPALGMLLLPATGLALNVDQPTFVDDIAPILHENCASCHRPEEIAPMSLRTYREVRPWARSIARAVENRDMPPWDADPGYGPWANDISLSDDEIAAIANWVAAGAPRGDGDEPVYEQPAVQAEWAFGEPDWVYEFDPFDVAADGPDQFAMIPIAPGFEEDRWIRAVEVQPGDREVLHHFILWRASDASTEVQDAWIDAWAAGVGATELPAGTARFLPKGRGLLGDFHYHPNGTASTDRTRVGVWFAEPEEVEKELINLWVMNAAFRIPAGDPNYEARASHVFSQDVVVRSLAPHMHYRGKDMKYTAHLPDGAERELLKRQPLRLQLADVLRVRGTGRAAGRHQDRGHGPLGQLRGQSSQPEPDGRRHLGERIDRRDADRLRRLRGRRRPQPEAGRRRPHQAGRVRQDPSGTGVALRRRPDAGKGGRAHRHAVAARRQLGRLVRPARHPGLACAGRRHRLGRQPRDGHGRDPRPAQEDRGNGPGGRLPVDGLGIR